MTDAYPLRQIVLPDGVPGKLFAAQMPGRPGSDFEDDRRVIQESGVDTVVCLAPLPELHKKSPFYARALLAQNLPWNAVHLPVPDFGVPEDREAFLQMARHVAGQLSAGDWVLVHCFAGIGRTGMFATLVLMALGNDYQQARQSVEAAGSGAEEPQQRALEKWAAGQLKGS